MGMGLSSKKIDDLDFFFQFKYINCNIEGNQNIRLKENCFKDLQLRGFEMKES